MNANRIDKKITRYILFFQLFRKSNLAYMFYKKTRKSILSNWLYITIPILLYSLNIFFIVFNNVFWNKDIKMSFISDVSNSVVFTILYFLSFFLSSLYPYMFDEWIFNGLDKIYFCNITLRYNNKYNSRFCVFFVGAVLFIIGGLSGFFFYHYSLENNDIEIWTYYIGIFGRVYYCITLGIIWYLALSLLGMALSSGFVIFWSLKGKVFNYVKDYYNNNLSIVNAVNILLCTFSYGLFYILGAILFIFNDKVAEQMGINNTFSNDVASFILILVVSMLVIAAFVPLQELIKFMQKEKSMLLKDYEQKILQTYDLAEKEKLIEERKELVSQSLIITSASNKFFIIISILIPLIGVIFQGIELFN